MKNYTITVNGKSYDVSVEENGRTALASPIKSSVVEEALVSVSGEGSIKIEAGAAGKVFKIAAPAGTQVKLGDPIIILEVMKMETPVVAIKNGVVASINVTEGQAIEAGELLATMDETK